MKTISRRQAVCAVAVVADYSWRRENVVRGSERSIGAGIGRSRIADNCARVRSAVRGKVTSAARHRLRRGKLFIPKKGLTKKRFRGGDCIPCGLGRRIQRRRPIDDAVGAHAGVRRAHTANSASIFGAHPIEECLPRCRGRIEERSFHGRPDCCCGRGIVRGVAKDAIEVRAGNRIPANSDFG